MGMFTHVIQVPPMTDSMVLVGAYRALMETMQINTDALQFFPPCPEGISHPVPEAMVILENDFKETWKILQTSYLFHGSLTVNNMRFMSGCCVFTFTHPD